MSPRSVAALLAIAALAFALRFYRLTEVPPGLYLDEASIGVEAHSVLETGRDQTGTRFPVLFKALDDYKHPLYVYGTVATEAALGPTKLAVRLPAALFGTLTVFLIAFLAMELSKDARAGLAAALILAVTPWHIQYSRMAWEAVTLGLTTVLALWLYFLARRRGGAWRFALAGAAFGLVLYSYTPAKLLVPAFLAALAPVVLPVLLIASNTIVEALRTGDRAREALWTSVRPVTATIGHPVMALFVSAVLAMWLYARRRRATRAAGWA